MDVFGLFAARDHAVGDVRAADAEFGSGRVDDLNRADVAFAGHAGAVGHGEIPLVDARVALTVELGDVRMAVRFLAELDGGRFVRQHPNPAACRSRADESAPIDEFDAIADRFRGRGERPLGREAVGGKVVGGNANPIHLLVPFAAIDRNQDRTRHGFVELGFDAEIGAGQGVDNLTAWLEALVGDRDFLAVHFRGSATQILGEQLPGVDVFHLRRRLEIDAARPARPAIGEASLEGEWRGRRRQLREERGRAVRVLLLERERIIVRWLVVWGDEGAARHRFFPGSDHAVANLHFRAARPHFRREVLQLHGARDLHVEEHLPFHEHDGELRVGEREPAPGEQHG